MAQIEVLYFEGCPLWQSAWEVLGTVLVGSHCEASLQLRDVTTMAPEELDGFAGSPTIRIEGIDLFGIAGPAVTACRRYVECEGLGTPPAVSIGQGSARRIRRSIGGFLRRLPLSDWSRRHRTGSA